MRDKTTNRKGQAAGQIFLPLAVGALMILGTVRGVQLLGANGTAHDAMERVENLKTLAREAQDAGDIDLALRRLQDAINYIDDQATKAVSWWGRQSGMIFGWAMKDLLYHRMLIQTDLRHLQDQKRAQSRPSSPPDATRPREPSPSAPPTGISDRRRTRDHNRAATLSPSPPEAVSWDGMELGS